MFSLKHPRNGTKTASLFIACPGEFATDKDRKLSIRDGQLVAINAGMFHSVISQRGMCYHCLTLVRQFSRDSGIPTTELYFRELPSRYLKKPEGGE